MDLMSLFFLNTLWGEWEVQREIAKILATIEYDEGIKKANNVIEWGKNFTLACLQYWIHPFTMALSSPMILNNMMTLQKANFETTALPWLQLDEGLIVQGSSRFNWEFGRIYNLLEENGNWSGNETYKTYCWYLNHYFKYAQLK